MANLNIFDPATGRTKMITADMGGSIIIQDLDADLDYFVRLATTAKMKSGAAIPVHTIRNLWDGASTSGTQRHDHTTPLPYANLSEAVNDHVWEMVEGNISTPTSAMDFSR